MKLPLEGIKVVEMSTIIAAPTAARFLCAYGAEVTKVEDTSGDLMRVAGEWQGTPIEEEHNPLFTIVNSNKKLTSINLKSPEGLEVMFKLLEDADVFITNIRMGGLKRLGLDYESLHERLPRLIYAHLSGYGVNGPDCNAPGYDLAAFWMRTGTLSHWQEEGCYPMVPSYGFGDMATSSVLASGVLMALIGRQNTGVGTLISSSLFASGIWCNSVDIVAAQEKYGVVRKNDPLRPVEPFWAYYKCKDGLYIGIFCKNFYALHEKYADVLGIGDLGRHPDFKNVVSLHSTGMVEKAVRRLNENFLTKTTQEWAEVFIKEDIPYAIAKKPSEVTEDAQALENGYVSSFTFPSGDTAFLTNPPLEFSEYGRRPYESCGKVGRDTDEVLASLGYSPEQIEKMKAVGAVVG